MQWSDPQISLHRVLHPNLSDLVYCCRSTTVKLPIGLVILLAELELIGFSSNGAALGAGKGGCFIPHTAELGENLALLLSLRVFTIFLAQIWPLFAFIHGHKTTS